MTADDRSGQNWPSGEHDGTPSYDAPAWGDPRAQDAPAWGETPTYGEAPSYGEAPTYGDAPVYGDAPTYGESRSYDDGGYGSGAGYSAAYAAEPGSGHEPAEYTSAEMGAQPANVEGDPVSLPRTDDELDPTAAAAEAELAEQQARVAEREAQLTQLFTATIVGPGDEKIGKVGQVYLDDQTQVPNWVTARTGLFGTKEYFIPLDEAQLDGNRIVVPYGKADVLAAPATEIDQNLSPAEEDALYEHYRVPGRSGGADRSTVLPTAGAAATGASGAAGYQDQGYQDQAYDAGPATEAYGYQQSADQGFDPGPATEAYGYQQPAAGDQGYQDQGYQDQGYGDQGQQDQGYDAEPATEAWSYQADYANAQDDEGEGFGIESDLERTEYPDQHHVTGDDSRFRRPPGA